MNVYPMYIHFKDDSELLLIFFIKKSHKRHTSDLSIRQSSTVNVTQWEVYNTSTINNSPFLFYWSNRAC